jgi:hypothetical protein
MTSPSLYALNASFYERDDLRVKQVKMQLMMNPADADARGIGTSGEGSGGRGLVAGVRPRQPLGERPHLPATDGCRGRETFYDNRVEVQKKG